ncbi:MAG: sulfatase-like hydrolase/transferase [Planctomycetes bacterium]|nr:sulfatase-like hydrolase/transferase [Planctomycetota bacterium]MCH9723549.1 sulfatase-like hydrolase/transferase [Planctomycetota bacterium]MCH9775342.1 sulfatase-like hydrolase/transferase [Planctomycetota bacterium]MCH9790135.1 sulfatase-like hydrolase/transferase [Planctomycetota bacterium]
MNSIRPLLVVLGVLITSLQSSEASENKPNIVLIMADDVGCDAIGCYGGQSYPTPHIDALAAGGMKFNHGYSMPVCHPSRICMMTGRYPFRFGKQGLKWGDYPTAAEGISIGNRMKQAGYATAVAGKWQVCTMKNDLDHPRRVGFDEWCLFGWHEGGRYNDPLIYQNGKVREGVSGKYGPDLYVDFLVNFMQRSQDSDKPFFAYYPMALCHDVTDDLKDQHVAYYKDGRWMTYGEMVASMDDMVGRLAQALDRMGVRNETLIIFTTDNGTPGASYLNVDENGKMVRPKVFSIRNGKIVPGGKGKHDDTGTRVPLIANWPGHIKSGKVVNDMVDLTDYLPTVAEIAGLKDDGVTRDGISFAPILFGQKRSRTRPWVYCEHNKKRSVRSLDWRLYDDGRFFDLKNDPTEQFRIKRDQLDLDTLRNYLQLQIVLEEMQLN